MTLNSITRKLPIWIIEFLKKGPATKQEILDAFNIRPTTFYKHINLLKKTGYVLEIEKDIYELYEFKNQIEFDKYDREALARIKYLVGAVFSKEQNKLFDKTFKKIIYLGNDKNYQETITAMEFYKQVEAVLNTKERLRYYTPISFYEKELALCALMENLSSQQEEKMQIGKETLFELYGKLAESYILKEGERVVSKDKGRIVIANGYEDKTILFKRLLRYDVLCKVIHPKKDVKDFKEMLLKTIKMFEEDDEAKQAIKILS